MAKKSLSGNWEFPEGALLDDVSEETKMNEKIKISSVQFTAAGEGDVARGLLGWVSCTLNNTLHLDGVAVRRTADGRHALSFPARRDAQGRQHFLVRPLDDTSRREIEAQVFKALGLEEVGLKQ